MPYAILFTLSLFLLMASLVVGLLEFLSFGFTLLAWTATCTGALGAAGVWSTINVINGKV